MGELFKPGEVLIYRDRVYKMSWRVIKLHKHRDWSGYDVCYVISAPPENEEDLNTVMNVPVFYMYRPDDPRATPLE